ncbi:aldo/keto reductase [Kitasatospora sp. NRRL B-11411]|uniref:aldo/keto reductase n=1 Tax=Kitasatospora sp. NRRL B-11411 TaxID=1463822 RepID=UPI000B301E69|nr:aldo/keto reductase [Kitasatospora sp. NRRL B-11411]
MDCGVTALDTAFNYRGFTSHATLAGFGRDLLARFTVSTKVGYFPAAGGTRHSLAPEELKGALGQCARDLGREPDVLLLHNPEASLAVDEQGREQLASACEVLAETARAGGCGAWGIASWNPRVLVGLGGQLPFAPEVLLVRAGLLVGHEVLAAAESLAAQWGIRPEQRWGMSPFGGGPADAPWGRSAPRIFLAGESAGASAVQAAFRVAFEVPGVGAVAVGTDRPDHLRELVDATGLAVDRELIRRYRELLVERADHSR